MYTHTLGVSLCVLSCSSHMLSTIYKSKMPNLCLCSRSAPAARSWWSVTAGTRARGRSGTVAPAPRAPASLIIAAWEAAGAARWLLPGTPHLQKAMTSLLEWPLLLVRLTFGLPFPLCSHSSSGMNRIVQITNSSVPSGGGGNAGFKPFKGTQRQF